MIDWRVNSNIIRAYPLFHNKPRYDFALVKIDEDHCIFVQVLYILQITYTEACHFMALMLPFDLPRLPIHSKRDSEMRLTQVCPWPRGSSLFIDTNSIIRGALLAEDPSSPGGEHLVVDFIDKDMWMRLKSTTLITNAVI